MQTQSELQRIVELAEQHSREHLGRGLTRRERRLIEQRYRNTGTTFISQRYRVAGTLWDLTENWRPMPRCPACLEYLHQPPCTRTNMCEQEN